MSDEPLFQNTDEQERAYAPPELARMTLLSASQPTSLDTGS